MRIQRQMRIAGIYPPRTHRDLVFYLLPINIPRNSHLRRLTSLAMDKLGITRDDRIIIVMGPTGAGKSTFISYATGDEGQDIGHSLKSFTRDIIVRKTIIKGESFALIDTPGFNDTTRSDYEILGEIAAFLTAAQKGRYRLDKLLYLHRISDNRMAGTPLRNLELFASVCGNVAMPNVTIVTTMWNLVTPQIGEERVRQLRESFWTQMINGGCDITKFRDSRPSAEDIIGQKREAQTTLLAQELVTKGKNLNTTAAGIMLSKQLEKLLQDEKASSLKLQQLSQQQNNAAARQHLESELNDIRKSISQKVSELGQLHRSFLDIILGWFYNAVGRALVLFRF
ncbi:hypothetical protein FRC19_006477 [Serendipita sp. 401]|nr:hypothetical protein FRC15_000639 [Serendipita sp. 397]KAG8828379.1 hypothetical protein FRC19_006477 [Serendipita sp. 401]KAG9058514.1 hypothetical protein FS842_008811 [Serendipita sp. 407]